MLYYPQLSSGSIGQFPITRRTVTRTFTNDLVDGNTIRMADSGAEQVQWQLQYSGLTDTEWSSIEQFFQGVQGRLTTFTFLDPTDNLLMWSEDWTQPVWTADPLLQVLLGVADPLGRNGAVQLTNTAQTTQRVLQTIAGPSWFQYCFSIYLRSDSPATVNLVITSQGQDALHAVSIGSAWSRAVTTTILPVQQDGISFGLQLPAGIRADAFGAQVEAQLAAGSYKKNIDRGGVYSATRFDSDSLVQTTGAQNQNSCSVNLVSQLA